MSAGHNPGPLMRDNFSVTTCAPAGEKRRTVAICSPDLSLSSMASMERMRANATLFAAAPELLEALEGLLKIRSGRTVKVAKAAIAKARGDDTLARATSALNDEAS